MKRIGKSRSFEVKRSTTTTSRGQRRERSMDRRVIRSYEEIALNENSSDESDQEQVVEPDDSESAWASIAASIPNLLWTSSPAATTTTSQPPSSSRTTFRTPPRTRSKFKPSYLLQKRKQALAQHPPPSYLLPKQHSRKQSFWALLFLAGALYLLLSLKMDLRLPLPTSLWSSSTDPLPTQHYLNLKEDRPIHIVAKMMRLHAYAYNHHHNHLFAGVCGYPAYQAESQHQASQLLEQLGLHKLLRFDVCPPIEAVWKQDPHYVVWEETDLPKTDLKTNLGWQAAIAVQAQPTNAYNHHEMDELWRQVLNASTQHQSQENRRLRGMAIHTE